MGRTLALIGAALLIAIPLAWIGGEQHRENCLRASRTDCTVWPWRDGQAKNTQFDFSTAQPSTDSEAERLLRKYGQEP